MQYFAVATTTYMRKISAILNLHEGADDKEKTLHNIKKNIKFSGSNLWVLACAIIIASIGLNVNSPSVIIGAMLISPLMAPVVGAGFALGVYDFVLFKRSLRNLFNAAVVSLSVSTLYFFISPFKDVQSELLSQTSPTIYDILVAFFGGIVGVIAVTRIEKGNPIPGVAIATALMPPLCTAGYGLATAHYTYFFGAFYLFCINCVFIGIATFLMVKYLKFPAKEQVNPRLQKQVKFIITLLIVIMLVPGSYLAYTLYKEQEFKRNADTFIKKEFTDKGYIVVFKKTDYTTRKKDIELAFLSKHFEKPEMDTLNKHLDNSRILKGSRLVIRQDSTDRFSAFRGDILKRIQSNENEVNEKDIKIAQLEKQLTGTAFDNAKIFQEAKVLFPGVTSVSVANHSIPVTKDSLVTVTTILYKSDKPLAEQDRLKMQEWLKQRLSVKEARLYRVE